MAFPSPFHFRVKAGYYAMYHYNDQFKLPSRKGTRMKNYSYRTPGYYFITICTHEKKCIFWSGEKRNFFGNIAFEAVFKIPDHNPGVKVDRFVIMPNHVHMILILENEQNDVSFVIGQYKAYVTKRIHEYKPDQKVWQGSFHDHVIRNRKAYEKISTYIEYNPIQWNMDCFYTEN